MKFPGAARAALLTAAVVAEVAGLGLAVLPAAALTFHHPPGPAIITISGGGDRATSDSGAGLAGVRFGEQHANPPTYTTGGSGKCTLSVYAGDHRVTQQAAPAGWYLSPQLGISPNSYSTPVVVKDYSSLRSTAT